MLIPNFVLPFNIIFVNQQFRGKHCTCTPFTCCHMGEELGKFLHSFSIYFNVTHCYRVFKRAWATTRNYFYTLCAPKSILFKYLYICIYILLYMFIFIRFGNKLGCDMQIYFVLARVVRHVLEQTYTKGHIEFFTSN